MVTLEAILERNNLNRAYKQVKANRGGPGVDGMTVDELLDYLRAHAVEIVETVKAGKYPEGGERQVQTVGNSNCCRSSHPTGDRAETERRIRTSIQFAQSWLSPVQELPDGH